MRTLCQCCGAAGHSKGRSLKSARCMEQKQTIKRVVVTVACSHKIIQAFPALYSQSRYISDLGNTFKLWDSQGFHLYKPLKQVNFVVSTIRCKFGDHKAVCFNLARWFFAIQLFAAVLIMELCTFRGSVSADASCLECDPPSSFPSACTFGCLQWNVLRFHLHFLCLFSALLYMLHVYFRHSAAQHSLVRGHW